MNYEERTEILHYWKLVDKVVPNTAYKTTIFLLYLLNYHSYAHGDDLRFYSKEVDITHVLR